MLTAASKWRLFLDDASKLSLFCRCLKVKHIIDVQNEVYRSKQIMMSPYISENFSSGT